METKSTFSTTLFWFRLGTPCVNILIFTKDLQSRLSNREKERIRPTNPSHGFGRKRSVRSGEGQDYIIIYAYHFSGFWAQSVGMRSEEFALNGSL